MIIITHKQNDEVRGFTEDGMMYFQDRPPESIVHVRRIYFTSQPWPELTHYYDAYSKKIVQLSMDQQPELHKITTFIPAEFTHLMTSTTPFELTSNNIFTLCARSYIWVFVGGKLKERAPILPDNASQYFDMNQKMTTVIYHGVVYVYQNNVMLKSRIRCDHRYHFRVYPKYMTFVQISDGCTMRDNRTGNIYMHEEATNWYKLPYNCDQHYIIESFGYGLIAGRIIPFDLEYLIPKPFATLYDIEV